MPRELLPDPGSNTESPEQEIPSSSTLQRNSDNRSNKSTESIKSIRKVMDRSSVIHPLNFSVSDLQNSPKLPKRNKRKKDEITIPMRDLTLTMSPVRVHRREKRSDHDNSSTLKRVTESREKDDTLKRTTDFGDIRFADENSESSNEIKFADDSPDSNRLNDKYEVRA